jgi:hypothetical protein
MEASIYGSKRRLSFTGGARRGRGVARFPLAMCIGVWSIFDPPCVEVLLLLDDAIGVVNNWFVVVTRVSIAA